MLKFHLKIKDWIILSTILEIEKERYNLGILISMVFENYNLNFYHKSFYYQSEHFSLTNKFEEKQMLDELDYTIEEGKETPNDICVYALSTCGHCKRGLSFLRQKNIKFRYIYVDLMPHDLRMRIKKELSDKYNERIGFPFCVINDGETILVGFTEEKWKNIFK